MKENESNLLEEIPGIYCFTNTENNNKYIGQTINIKKRFIAHYNNKLSNTNLQTAIKSFGIDKFEYEVLEYIPEKISRKNIIFQLDLFSKEDKLSINKALKGTNRNNILNLYLCVRELFYKRQYNFNELYNKLPALEWNAGNDTVPIIAMRLSDKGLEFYYAINYAARELTKLKFNKSASTRSITHALNKTEIVIGNKKSFKKQSAYNRVWIYGNQENYNKEELEKRYELSKNNPYSRSCAPKRKISQFDLKGNFIEEFASANEAMRNTSICDSGILKCCKNKRNTAGNFIWKYSDA